MSEPQQSRKRHNVTIKSRIDDIRKRFNREPNGEAFPLAIIRSAQLIFIRSMSFERSPNSLFLSMADLQTSATPLQLVSEYTIS
jgi:hypothetical protein